MKPLLSPGAIDVLRPFHVACSEHGVPDVLAIDRGNENCLLQQAMNARSMGDADVWVVMRVALAARDNINRVRMFGPATNFVREDITLAVKEIR